MKNNQVDACFVLMLLASRKTGRKTSPFPWHLMFGKKVNNNGAEESSAMGPEVNEKVKELLLLAQEQGYLTSEDVQECLPPEQSTPQLLEQISVRLAALDIEIVDQADVEAAEVEEETAPGPDSLEDPVRVYM